MEYRENNFQGWTMPAVRITSGYNSFDECEKSDVRKAYKWRLSYFEFLSFKNTYDAPYLVDIKEWNLGNGQFEPYLLVVADAEHKDRIVDLLEWLDYGNIKVEETSILCVDELEVYDKFGYISHIVEL